MMHGANIRFSSMDLSMNKVSLVTLDDKYLPTAIVLPFEGHTRQSKLMHAQVAVTEEKKSELWLQIIKQKIYNQSRLNYALKIVHCSTNRLTHKVERRTIFGGSIKLADFVFQQEDFFFNFFLFFGVPYYFDNTYNQSYQQNRAYAQEK